MPLTIMGGEPHVIDYSSQIAHQNAARYEADARMNEAAMRQATENRRLAFEQQRWQDEPGRDAAKQDRAAALEMQAYQGKVSIQEQMENQRKQNQIGAIRSAVDNGYLTQDEANNEILRLQSGVNRFEIRHQQTQQAIQQQQLQHLTMQNNFQQSLQTQNEEVANGNDRATIRYNPAIEADETTRAMTENPGMTREQATQHARATMTQDNRGVEYGRNRLRANGEVHWEPSTVGGGGGGGTRGTPSGGEGGHEVPETVRQRIIDGVRRDHPFDPSHYGVTAPTGSSTDAQRTAYYDAVARHEREVVRPQSNMRLETEGYRPPPPQRRILPANRDDWTEQQRRTHSGFMQVAETAWNHIDRDPEKATEVDHLARQLAAVYRVNGSVEAMRPSVRARFERDSERMQTMLGELAGRNNNQQPTPTQPAPAAQAPPVERSAGYQAGQAIRNAPMRAAMMGVEAEQRAREIWRGATQGVENFDRWLGRQGRDFWSAISGR